MDDPGVLRERRAPILEALRDKDEDVRWSAYFALEGLRIDLHEHKELLSGVLEGESSPRVRSLILGQLSALLPSADLAEALPAIGEVVRGGGANAVDACKLVAHMGAAAKAVVPSLVSALEGEGYVAINAARALWAIERRAEAVLPVLEKHLDEHGEMVCDAICELGPAAAPLLPGVLRALETEDWDLQWAAADALGAIASSEPECMRALAEGLSHPSPIVKAAAAKALAAVGPPALGLLIALLCDKEDPGAEWAAHALGMIGSLAKEAAPHLRETMKSARKPLAVWSAIALAKVAGDPAAVPPLIEILAESDRPDLQVEAAEALGAMGPSARGALETLRASLDQDDVEVHNAVSDAIAAIEVRHH